MVGKYQAYADYKYSGCEFFREIPTHWSLKRIKETANLINGYPFDSKRFESGKGTPLVRIRDINSSITEVGFVGDVPSESLINTGDLLIGMDGDFNVSLWLGGVAALNQRVACVRASDEYWQKFIYYVLPFKMKVVNELTYFTTVKHLSSIDILKSSYPTPPKLELINIVNFLDHETAKIDTLIAKQQQLIALLKEKRQAVISHAVTKGLNPNAPKRDSGVEWLGEVPAHWQVVPIKYLCTLIKDGTHLPPPRVDVGIPLLSVRNIVDGKFIFRDDDSNISIKDYGELCRSFIPQEGDVLLAIVGATLGKVAVIERMSDFHIQRSVAIFRVRKDLLSFEFLANIFSSSNFQSLMWEYVGFSAQPGIYLGTLQNFRAPVPSLEEQVAINNYCKVKTTGIDKLIASAVKGVELMQERRTALISAAVTGKIDVRGWRAPEPSRVGF